MTSLLVPGTATPGAAVAGSTDPGFPVPPGSADYYVTLDTAQEITGAKTFDAEVVIDVASGPGLLVSRDGTDTSAGAFLVRQDLAFNRTWFGIYDPGNSLYYGISQELPAPTGTSTLGGYYQGLGVGGAPGGGPMFGVLASSQSGNGRGNTAFTIYTNNDVETFNNVLDDGTGNMFLSGGLAQNLRTATSSGTLTASDSTVLLNGATLTATLPTAAGITGRAYTVKLVAASTGTVATTSSQTIDGSTTYSLSAQYKYVTVQSDGSNWFIIASN